MGLHVLGNGPLMLGNGPHVLGNGTHMLGKGLHVLGSRPYVGIMSFEIMPHSGLCCLGLCCILDCVIRDYVVWYTVRVSVYQVKIFSSTVQFKYRHIQKTIKNFDLYVCRHIQGTVKIFLSLR